MMNTRKKVLSLVLAGVMFFACFSVIMPLAVQARTPVEDMRLIKERIRNRWMSETSNSFGTTVRAQDAMLYLQNMREDGHLRYQSGGQWVDFDYDCTESTANGQVWWPEIVLNMIQFMANAYANPGSSGNGLVPDAYKNPVLLAGIQKSLGYWMDYRNTTSEAISLGIPRNAQGVVTYQGPWSRNWWNNSHSRSRRFYKIALLLSGEGTGTTDGWINFTSANTSLSREWRYIVNQLGGEASGETGQNGLWSAESAVYRGLIEENQGRIERNMRAMSRCMVIQTKSATLEAIQVDNSFWSHGDQYFANGYGRDLFIDISQWLEWLADTQFLPQDTLDNIAFFFMEGTAWTIRRETLELMTGYANIHRSSSYVAALNRMMTADPNPERKAAYQAIRDNIQGNRADNGLAGNKYMWRSAYMSHMTADYAVNIRMDADWMKGFEIRRDWPNQANRDNLLYWSASASSVFAVDGTEYSSVFPVFDWRHTPGATAPHSLHQNVSHNGPFVMNSSVPFAAGVSDGNYGVTAYHYNKGSSVVPGKGSADGHTTARKGYFIFDNEIVALGAGISSTSGITDEIHTTINQSRANSVTAAGTNVPLGTTGGLYSGRWLHNDKIGYVFPKDTEFYVSNRDHRTVSGDTGSQEIQSLWSANERNGAANVFSAWIDHGKNPDNDSYEYIVLPGKNAAQTEQYANNIPITILANTPDIQAVQKDHITQINFYTAVSGFEYRPNRFISADRACVVMIDHSGDEPLLHAAVGDHTERTDVTITTRQGDAPAIATVLRSQSMPYTGQTMTARIGDNTTVVASSFTGENHPAMIRSDNTQTMWKSDTSEEQWIYWLAEGPEGGRIQTAEITWGDEYAEHYKIQVSSDGRHWFDIAEITNGKGGTESVRIGDINRYIRVLCLKSANGKGYEIKHISEYVTDDAVMKFSSFEREYMLQDNDRILTQWHNADSGATDLTKYNPANLYLRLNVFLDWYDTSVTTFDPNRLINGSLTLGSNNDNTVRWNSRSFALQKGMNRLDLPLEDLMNGQIGPDNGTSGQINWSAVRQINMSISNLGNAQVHSGVFFTIEITGARIELVEDHRLELGGLLTRIFAEEEHTEESYAVYAAARQTAQEAYDNPLTADHALRDAVNNLRQAIEGLERIRGRIKVMTFNYPTTLHTLNASGFLYPGWRAATEGATDLTKYDPKRLSLKMNVELDWDTNVVANENFQLPVHTGRTIQFQANPENSPYGYNTTFIRSLEWKRGMNNVTIPLADMIGGTIDPSMRGTNGTVDWTRVTDMYFVLITDLRPTYGDANITMRLTNVHIEYDGIIDELKKDLQDLLESEFDPADYDEDAFDRYLSAKSAAQTAIDTVNDEQELRGIINELSQAIKGLVKFAPGNPTGIGTISVLDIIAVRNHILGTERLSGNALRSADANNDGIVNIFDMLVIRNMIVGRG
ncbi:MAG: discoidin domain-containing protein [Oscillospiraceae bacterium]|nr:discoidin domain-containing protein [Oscillospiraceae bacterium]